MTTTTDPNQDLRAKFLSKLAAAKGTGSKTPLNRKMDDLFAKDDLDTEDDVEELDEVEEIPLPKVNRIFSDEELAKIKDIRAELADKYDTLIKTYGRYNTQIDRFRSSAIKDYVKTLATSADEDKQNNMSLILAMLYCFEVNRLSQVITMEDYAGVSFYFDENEKPNNYTYSDITIDTQTMRKCKAGAITIAPLGMLPTLQKIAADNAFIEKLTTKPYNYLSILGLEGLTPINVVVPETAPAL